MKKRFVRVWKELDVEEVAKKLIVVGELSAECFVCHNIGLDVDTRICPYCQAGFRYMAFRRKVDGAYIARKQEAFPDMTFIDFDDFKHLREQNDARKLLDL